MNDRTIEIQCKAILARHDGNSDRAISYCDNMMRIVHLKEEYQQYKNWLLAQRKSLTAVA